MKKVLTALLCIAMVFTLSLSSFAALAQEEAGRFGIEGGKPVSGTVTTKTSTVTVSGTAYGAQATGMIRQINLIRKDAGLPELERDTRLADAAQQRALEISVSFSHTRPDGSKWRTVSSLVNGENLGVGIDNYAGIVGQYSDKVSGSPQSFMESQSHRSAILDPDFSRVETYVFETGGEMYWVQLFGAGKGTEISTSKPETTEKPSGSTSSGTSSAAAKNGQSTSSSTTTTKASSSKELTSEALTKAVKNATASNGVVQVKVKNYKSVSASALADAVKAGGTSSVQILADTMSENGKSTVGRMYIDVSELTGMKEDLKLGISLNSKQAQLVKNRFAKWYKNETVVVSFDHTGSFGTSVHVAVKADLSKLDAENLVFYSYNSETNKIVEIEKPNYSVKDGYLHFYTSVGNDVVITDKAWSK